MKKMSVTRSTQQKDNRSTIPSLGDTDQDPDSTDLWFSFEEGNEENNRKSQTLAYLDDDDHHHKVHTLDFLDDGTSILPDYLKEYARSLPELAHEDFAVEVKFIKKMNLEEKIKRVQSGIFVQDCLHNVAQDFSKGAQIYDKHKLTKMLNKNYNKNKDGTIEMINKDLTKRQNQVLFYLFKQFGSSLFSGKPVMSLSLPIMIFEPRSELERHAQQLVYAPYFLEKGGSTRNTFEQFKLSVTHFLASLHTSISPYKSFSPDLGETFQGVIGGCPVYLEQISQGPSVLAFEMLGKNFITEGCMETSPSMWINTVKYKRLGFSKVIYKNNRTEVQAQYPSIVVSGLAYGKKSIQFEGKFYIVDLENQYYAEINFDASKEKSFSDERNKLGRDYFSGSIWKINENFADMLRKNMKGTHDIGVKFIEKENAIFRIENIEGLWLEYVKIGDNTYWTFGNPWPYQLQRFDHGLPSDSDNRLDILYLKQNDEIKAQENKKILEERQKKDKKLRDQAKRARSK